MGSMIGDTRLNKVKYIIHILIWITGIVGIQAQNISVSQLPIMDQLPSNSVQRVFQDKEGYLWFGTLDGLCRYDGYRVHVFRSDFSHPDLLTNNEITCIAEDKNDNIWIGTRKGLNILNKKNYQIAHFYDQTIQSQPVRAIVVASDSTIWVGAGNSICRYNTDHSLKKQYTNDSGTGELPNGGINSIYEDLFGNIWITIWNSGLYKYQKETNSFIAFPRIGAQNKPFKIFQDNHKQYWICTWGDGLFLFNPNNNEQNIYTPMHIDQKGRKQPEDTFYSIVQDDVKGYVWVMSLSGLNAFEYTDNKTIKEKDISSMFHQSNNIFSEIIKDYDGNLWIGAFSEGIITVNFNKPAIKNYDIESIKQKTGISPNITTIYSNSGTNIFNLANIIILN